MLFRSKWSTLAVRLPTPSLLIAVPSNTATSCLDGSASLCCRSIVDDVGGDAECPFLAGKRPMRSARIDPQLPFGLLTQPWPIPEYNGRSHRRVGRQVIGHCRRSGDDVGKAAVGPSPAVRASMGANVRSHCQRTRAILNCPSTGRKLGDGFQGITSLRFLVFLADFQ